MSFLDNLKKLVNGVRVQIKCPGCRADSVQSAEKVQKNIALICPKCGCLFLPQDTPQP
ncbi:MULTISPECIES: YnfU family zinc-binding protein [Yersinia pseudotuberculosis complex]|uniref:Uncharacterized protein n=6 Tax=Yersinia pseudotuberculosis complex TaxID=1649845 RepID=A0AAX2I635_YERPE|nr:MULTISPECIES: YnfU family zinc-binding protein [Yersinia pseudotuberculosis complex]EDR32197.1 hypothetical protein YPIP275_0523 [Yersinia pestis biovar Orientalis str. IP275]EFA49681.1 conserved hypothetical protein [Yersinia pestis KIM D27]CQD49498.1 Uncharacterised protein [Yersinia intermedia]ABS45960.1 hypothetical protein YpsIP31758_1658 [Yersinia pseudotuberculosis IP 31758]AIN13596.1 hypothetical protein DJ40_4181 [Yersinia pseudotuberculosis]